MSTLSLLNIFGIRREGEVISNLEKRSAKGAKRSARRRKGRREKREIVILEWKGTTEQHLDNIVIAGEVVHV